MLKHKEDNLELLEAREGYFVRNTISGWVDRLEFEGGREELFRLLDDEKNPNEEGIEYVVDDDDV